MEFVFSPIIRNSLSQLISYTFDFVRIFIFSGENLKACAVTSIDFSSENFTLDLYPHLDTYPLERKCLSFLQILV